MWIAAIVATLAAVLRVFSASSLNSGDSSMKVWLLVAALALCSASPAFAFGPCCQGPIRTKTTQIKNADGTTTTVKVFTPFLFPHLRQQTTTSTR